MARWAALVAGVALLLATPSGGALLGNGDDDAGSGRDAGNSFDEATPLLPGTYRGNVSQPNDPDDYFAVDLSLGAWATLDVRSSPSIACAVVVCVLASDCVTLTLYAPNRVLREYGGCGETTEDDDFHSSVYFFLADEAGTWFARVSVGSRPEIPKQPYTIDFHLRAQHDHFLRQTFTNVTTASVRLDPGVGAYHALFLTDTLPLEIPGTPSADLVAAVFEPGSSRAGGFFYVPGALLAIRPVLATEAGSISASVQTELPSIQRPNRAGFLSFDESGHPPLVLVITSSQAFQATLLLSYDGSADLRAWQDSDADHMASARMSDFHSDLKLMTPIGGVVDGGEVQRRLGAGFAGFFRLPTAEGFTEREGGTVDPAGQRVSYLTPSHPNDWEFLVQPLAGDWTFWLNARGLDGDQRLLFGVNLPDDFVR